ncbi:MAG: ATP-binding protein, partial [Parachlamydiales bacterium]
MARREISGQKLIKPRIGKNLPHVLSRSLVADSYAAVSELVCNAYDEDAEHVHVDIDKGLGKITISDDGNGMDKKGLESFFRLGDSVKINEPLSPIKRRHRVGKYGIAKVLIQYLGRSFSVESVKDHKKYIIREGVTEQDLDVEEIPVARKVRNGTVITIKDLRFQPDTEQFSFQKLYSRLQWDPPNQPDFDVFVNGSFVKKRGVVTYAQTYRVEKDLGNGRIVNGRIYHLKNNGKKLEGVRIYVNNRAVGDEKLFGIEEISPVLRKGRLQGEINADFLEPFITLDRSDFQEDPLVEKTIDAVKEVLRGIKQDLDNRSVSKSAFYVGRDVLSVHIDMALGSAQEQFNRKLGTNYTLTLSDNLKAGPVAQLDTNENVIYINTQSKVFTFLKKEDKIRSRKDSEVYLRRAFLTAATLAYTSKDFKDQRLEHCIAQRFDETFSNFEGISSITNLYNDKPILIPLKEIYLNPHRLYDCSELSLLTGRPVKVIRLLHTSGALKGTEDHRYDKNGILETLKPLNGLLS